LYLVFVGRIYGTLRGAEWGVGTDCCCSGIALRTFSVVSGHLTSLERFPTFVLDVPDPFFVATTGPTSPEKSSRYSKNYLHSIQYKVKGKRKVKA